MYNIHCTSCSLSLTQRTPLSLSHSPHYLTLPQPFSLFPSPLPLLLLLSPVFVTVSLYFSFTLCLCHSLSLTLSLSFPLLLTPSVFLTQSLSLPPSSSPTLAFVFETLSLSFSLTLFLSLSHPYSSPLLTSRRCLQIITVLSDCFAEDLPPAKADYNMLHLASKMYFDQVYHQTIGLH